MALLQTLHTTQRKAELIIAAVVASQAPVTQQVSYTAPVTTVDYSAQSQAPVAQKYHTRHLLQRLRRLQPLQVLPTIGYRRWNFLVDGWLTIVMPESGGKPEHQTVNTRDWVKRTNHGERVAFLTKPLAGMLNYATSRYGSVDSAIGFRAANGWW